MIEPESWSFGNVVQTILALSFGLWAWLLKKFGEQHVVTIRELVAEMKEMRMEMVKIAERVHAVELRQEWMHNHKDD